MAKDKLGHGSEAHRAHKAFHGPSIETDLHIKQHKAELKTTKQEMKEQGIRKISAFNAGLSGPERYYNTRLFELKHKLGSQEKHYKK